MDWTYIDGEISEIDFEQWIGFIYLVQNKTNNRKYIGQKKLWFVKNSKKKNPKTGKIKTIKGRTESDWRTYYGSSPALKADVQNLGEENFTRTILKFCRTTGSMNYEELKEQIFRKVLETDEYYNGIIQVKIHKSHVPKNTSTENLNVK